MESEQVGGVPAAGGVRRVGGEGDKCVKKKTGQQAHAETNLKPGKEDEDDHDTTLDSFAICPL